MSGDRVEVWLRLGATYNYVGAFDAGTLTDALAENAQEIGEGEVFAAWGGKPQSYGKRFRLTMPVASRVELIEGDE